ncbi:MAG: RnfABCDGE type electron transport complex subunit D [Spirochaetes bacterium]|nr:RnfABCDGE type electron transport complex subunit D [Spirochaetota bacterium]
MAEDINTQHTERTQKTSKMQLVLSVPPHVRDSQSVTYIMWCVVISLLPAAGYSCYLYGLKAAKLLIASTISAIIAEAAYQMLMKKKITAHDGSAAITGLLLAMNVPPHAPVWMVCIGSAFAIIIAKQLFGGIGFNIFNPALAARAFLMASWPVHMTTAWHQFNPGNILAKDIANIANLPPTAFDAITSATPLACLKSAPQIIADYGASAEAVLQTLLSNTMLKSLFIGSVGGCLGETSALFLLIGATFLFIKRIISWHIPITYILTVAIFMGIYYALRPLPGAESIDHFLPRMVLFHILSGGLILGAFFMATDMVTSPVTHIGMIIYAIGCGVIASIIRLWGGYPEGVSYSILLMNAIVPLIDRYIKPKVFGTLKRTTGE